MLHCLDAQQFDREFLDELGQLTDSIRSISEDKAGSDWLATLLSHRRAMLYFVQPSTRTFLSFLSACQILGMMTAEVRDPRTSSEVKGESELDTVRTFSSYCDVIIMRYPRAGFAHEVAQMLDQNSRPVPVINGGSGKDQHPTQALLDVYTLMSSLAPVGGIDGKSIAFVGDLLRGRTVRSLSCLLTRYRDVRQFFVAPDSLQIGVDILAYLDEHNVSYELSDKLDGILSQVDAVYMTRLQDEWDDPGAAGSGYDVNKYSLNRENSRNLKPHAAIMHPLPRRHEIPAYFDADPRAMYWEQARNGMWTRAALLARVFGVHEEILSR